MRPTTGDRLRPIAPTGKAPEASRGRQPARPSAQPARPSAQPARPSAVSAIRVIVFDSPNRPQQRRLTLLSFVPGIDVVSSVASTMGLMVAVETTPFDVVLVALAHGPNPGGMAVLRRLSGRPSIPPVVVVSDTDDALRVDQALSLGAVGYVLSSAPSEEVIVALTLAAAGAAYLQPKVA